MLLEVWMFTNDLAEFTVGECVNLFTKPSDPKVRNSGIVYCSLVGPRLLSNREYFISSIRIVCPNYVLQHG